MTQQLSKQRFYWADLIRVISIFCVIVIHVSAGLLYDWGKIPFKHWMIGNLYDSFARISVPLLFMVSGSLLLGKKESIRVFFLKRVTRLGIPFIAWSLIYLFWRCQVNDQSCSLKIITRLFLLEGSHYHLWFLYALIGLYLATPLLRLMVFSGEKKVLWYFIILWICFQPGLVLLEKIWGLQIGVNVPMATGLVGFYVLGYLLSEISFSPKVIMLSLVIWLLSSIATAAGTYYMTLHANEFVGFFYDYLSINVILASGAAFIGLKRLADSKFMHHPLILNTVSRISVASFGVYLIHALIIDIIGTRLSLQVNTSIGNPVWSIMLVSVIVFTISFFIVYLLQKVPVLNRIVA